MKSKKKNGPRLESHIEREKKKRAQAGSPEEGSTHAYTVLTHCWYAGDLINAWLGLMYLSSRLVKDAFPVTCSIAASES